MLEFIREENDIVGEKRENGFIGQVRSSDSIGFVAGDVWTFPKRYEVFSQQIGSTRVQYIYIEVNGVTKKFFPSTFTKRRTICEEDGTLTTKRVHTMGTAAELFRTAETVAEGMDKLAGKTVKVTKVETIRCLQYGSVQVVNSQIPTIDLVE